MLCTHTVTYNEGQGRRSRTIFGFMALNGNDVVMVSETARKEDMLSFLGLVRRENRGRPILSVMDNAQIHRTAIVDERSEELGVIRTFLPPYSPDLQPIEFGWKDVKRELNGILKFDRAVHEARTVALKLFGERRTGYTSYWKEEFIDDKG